MSVLAVLGEVLAATARLLAEVRDLYRYGDADERRAVLLALHLLPVGDDGRDLSHDALRTNDSRLVAAALGPYGARVLDDAAWRQAVLKCVFMGVPLSAVHRPRRPRRRRAGRDARRACADERTAAGREIPADARDLLDRHATRGVR